MHKEKKLHQNGRKLVVRIMAVFLALMFVLMLGSQIFIYALAAEMESADTLRSRQEDLARQQQSYQTQLDELTEQKESAVSKYLLLDKQSKVIAEQIEDSNQLLEQCKDQVNQASKELEKAQQQRDESFELFCQRAAQMEQGGTVTLWETIFSAESMTELLTGVNDMKVILGNDRRTLDDVEALEQEVSDKEAQLKLEKQEQEAQLLELKQQQSELKKSEEEAAAVMAEIQQNLDAYADQISQLDSEQQGLEADILEAETLAALKAAEEKAREEEARAKEEASARRTALRAPETQTGQEDSQDEDAPGTEVVGTESSQTEAPAQEEPQQEPESTGSTYSGSGSDVVSYAVQFVGNPYVWGGTSLTNGCDCSGFVKSVYERFGYSLPHFSGALQHCGTGVSYSEAQPGDVICYDGHVGIYMGGGQMVNAFDSKHGIIICSVNVSRLVAVRRIL